MILPFFSLAQDLMSQFVLWFGDLYEIFNKSVTEFANENILGGFFETALNVVGIDPKETTLISMMFGAGLSFVVIFTVFSWLVKAIDYILPG